MYYAVWINYKGRKWVKYTNRGLFVNAWKLLRLFCMLIKLRCSNLVMLGCLKQISLTYEHVMRWLLLINVSTTYFDKHLVNINLLRCILSANKSFSTFYSTSSGNKLKRCKRIGKVVLYKMFRLQLKWNAVTIQWRFVKPCKALESTSPSKTLKQQ